MFHATLDVSRKLRLERSVSSEAAADLIRRLREFEAIRQVDGS